MRRDLRERSFGGISPTPSNPMCTVTLVPLIAPHGDRAGFRLATNRDESRQRPAALPPEARVFGPRHALLPRDPTGGGTWVAVNDAGLAFTLLNRNPGDMRGVTFPNRLSRGTIIPALLDAADLAAVRSRLGTLTPDRYAPFRLIACDGLACLEALGEADTLTLQAHALDRPLMFTSSGLGDALVEPPRRALFDGWFSQDPHEWPAQQDAFHRHRWPDRPELSVCMSRDDARSVSLTAVAVTAVRVSLTYHGAPPDEPCDDIALSLPRGGGA